MPPPIFVPTMESQHLDQGIQSDRPRHCACVAVNYQNDEHGSVETVHQV